MLFCDGRYDECRSQLPHCAARFRSESEEDLLKAFQTLDTEGQGFISEEELTKILLQEGEPFKQEEVEEMMAQAKALDKDVVCTLDESPSMLSLTSYLPPSLADCVRRAHTPPPRAKQGVVFSHHLRTLLDATERQLLLTHERAHLAISFILPFLRHPYLSVLFSKGNRPETSVVQLWCGCEVQKVY